MEGITFSFFWEVGLLTWLQSIANPVIIEAANCFAFFGEEIFIITSLGFLYWCWDKKKGKFIIVNNYASFICLAFAKNLFTRRRPYFDHEDIK